MKNLLFLLIILALVALFKGHVGISEASTKTINGAGATFPYPLYSAWASQYHKEKGIRVNYQSIGSGGGIRQITERTVDFGATDMPLKPEEVEQKKLLQFPTVIGGVVIAINVPEVGDKSITLDGETLCKIYLGEIKNWDDAKIKALNPGLSLPSKPITPVYRSDGSGTTAIFTHYLSSVCSAWARDVGFGTSVNFRVGIGAKGNEGVANYVKRTAYSLGYLEYAYAVQNKIRVSNLKNAKGKVVSPSVETFKEAAKTAQLDPAKHFYVFMTNAPGDNAWPIAGATYILLAKEKADINKEVIKFFDWALQTGDKTALELHYVPLPERIKTQIREYWKKQGLF